VLTDNNSLLLSVDNLCVRFGSNVVVNDLSLRLNRGKTLAIVGESGSGKSVSSLALMGLLGHAGGTIDSGDIIFYPDDVAVNLLTLSPEQQRKIRGKDISMIFQEPMTSLDPVFSIGSQIGEVLQLHRGLRGSELTEEARRLLDLVHIPNARDQLKRYPHQLSGGMRQRVMIAMALAADPKLLIADEPTTALDVTIQAQILQIIRDLQADTDTSVIFISHDMGVVSEMADDIIVMRRGELVESGSAEQVILDPQASYTQDLMAAVPRIGSMIGRSLPEKFDLPGVSVTSAQTEAVLVAEDTQPLIEVQGLTTRYDIRSGLLSRVTHRVHAAENINFTIHPGETLALVGESGSGKSTVGKTLQQLVAPVSGRVLFRGTDMLSLSDAEKLRFKREIQYIFQDPYGSLNPRKRVRESLLEPMIRHGLLHDADRQVADLLTSVGLSAEHAKRYPHEFSGGQRQRICIARALGCSPELIIADEAVSALDVSVQAQVINLMMDLQASRGLSYLFISHDMAVIERISHRVAVMYLGQIVEIGTRQQVFENPQHGYTQRLLSAIPVLDPRRVPERRELVGDIPSPIRKRDDPPSVHGYLEVQPGHFLADNYQQFNQQYN